MRPDTSQRPEGQTEAEYCTALADRHGPNSPATAGLPYVLIDDSTLPAAATQDAQGDAEDARHAWRWTGAAVVIAPAERQPNLSHLVPRLRALIPPAEWPTGMLCDLKEAVSEKDAETLRVLRDRFVSAVPARSADIMTTFTTKRVG